MVGTTGYRSPRDIADTVGFNAAYRINMTHQFEPATATLDRASARVALDELFALAHKYNSSEAYLELMRFVGRFRFYSPFNAMLIHTQMPGAQFVCTALRWQRDYHREIKIGARPIVNPATDGTSIVCV